MSPRLTKRTGTSSVLCAVRSPRRTGPLSSRRRTSPRSTSSLARPRQSRLSASRTIFSRSSTQCARRWKGLRTPRLTRRHAHPRVTGLSRYLRTSPCAPPVASERPSGAYPSAEGGSAHENQVTSPLLSGLHYHHDRQDRDHGQDDEHQRPAWHGLWSREQLEEQDGGQEQHAHR